MKTINVVIASLNPVKIEAVKEAFSCMLSANTSTLSKETTKDNIVDKISILDSIATDLVNFIPITVSSDVSAQPLGDKETLQGAATRALNAYKHYKEKKGVYPDYTVGIEGGVEFDALGALCFAYVYIRNDKGVINYTKTTPFLLPPKVGDLLIKGLELGDANDIVFNKSNSKQKEGAVGILTKGLLSRKSYYVHALKLCLIPFINEELYKKVDKSSKVVSTNVPGKPCYGCG